MIDRQIVDKDVLSTTYNVKMITKMKQVQDIFLK